MRSMIAAMAKAPTLTSLCEDHAIRSQVDRTSIVYRNRGVKGL